MAKKDLVSLTKFAELAEQDVTRISQLCAEPKIKVTMFAGKKFIDTSVYDPEDFKPKPKKEKS